MKINSSSPTRVDFAGGTLDCWPLYNFVGGSVTTNLSINIKTYVELEELAGQEVQVFLSDLEYEKNFESISEFLDCTDKELILLKAHVDYWKPRKGFKITCRSESPVGGGLGGSSSLSVSLIKAFSQWSEKVLSTMEIVTLASNLEAGVLMAPTGTQDYFPAIVEGLHIIEYGPDGPREKIYKAPVELIAEKMFLVYTGRPHNSGMNNWQVIKKAIDGDKKTLQHLHELNDVAFSMAEACENQKWDVIGALFEQEFEARVALSPGFNSPEIEQLKSIITRQGADAIKICGAGGGGCVMIWCRPEKRLSLMEAVTRQGYQVLDATPAGVS